MFVLVSHSDRCVRVSDISARKQPQVHGEPREAGDLVGRAQGEDGQTVALHPGGSRAPSTGILHTRPQGTTFIIIEFNDILCSYLLEKFIL